MLPPQVVGPLSECSRSVRVYNVVPNATVHLVATRNGAMREVGKSAPIANSTVTVPVDPTESLVAGDLVSAYQVLGTERSAPWPEPIGVQKSVAQFGPPQILTRPIVCSRALFLGGMRPGTTVQLLSGSAQIGTGTAVDGTAYVHVPDGIPPGALTVRQVICPKPPPQPPAPNHVHTSALPPAQPFAHQGSPIPAPGVAQGLTGCSRAIQLTGVIPGAEAIVEGEEGWWSAMPPSDATTIWVPLPVRLVEGRTVTVRQEVSRRCELPSETKRFTVGPQQTLPAPQLAQVDCNTTPSIHTLHIKPEADVEFSVTPPGGAEVLHRTVASKETPFVPAPPMPIGAQVKVRQGECDVWSPWSNVRTAQALVPPQKPKISSALFQCQGTIAVENVFPLAGTLKVHSGARGEIANVPISGNVMQVAVQPSLVHPDDVWVEHHVCGHVGRSDPRPVGRPQLRFQTTLGQPLFAGDTAATVEDVPATAYFELRELSGHLQALTGSAILRAGRAPFGNSFLLDMNLSGLRAFEAGWRLQLYFEHCGQTGLSNVVSVVHRAPELTQLVPSTALRGGAAMTLRALGKHFRAGASLLWGGLARPTTFVSATEVTAAIPAADLSTARTVQIQVRNPDSQMSATRAFTVQEPPPPSVAISLRVGASTAAIVKVTAATFTVVDPNGSATPLNGTLDATGRNATATYSRTPGLAGTYHVKVDADFEWREPSDPPGQVRPGGVSGPMTTSQGTPVLLTLGATVPAIFSIQQTNINPTRFDVVKV